MGVRASRLRSALVGRPRSALLRKDCWEALERRFPAGEEGGDGISGVEGGSWRSTLGICPAFGWRAREPRMSKQHSLRSCVPWKEEPVGLQPHYSLKWVFFTWASAEAPLGPTLRGPAQSQSRLYVGLVCLSGRARGGGWSSLWSL